MAMRVATMSPAENSPLVRKPGHLSRKLTLLLLLISAYALVLVLLFHEISGFPLILFDIFANCTIAIIAGFGARLVLSKRNWFIRSLAAMVTVVAGLAILGYFSQWKIGLDLIEISRGYLGWTDISHLTLGIMAALSALWAWRRRPRPSSIEIPAPVPVVPAPLNSTRSIRPRIRLPQNWSLNLGAMARPMVGTRSGNGSSPSVRARPKLVTGQALKPKLRRSSRPRPHVQLALVEEHRCPYCLELVLRTDPGGVKECKVCHSLHHADCWAITGTCQVPHLNSLV